MKEVEKNEIKRLSDRLDLIRHQMAGLSLVDSAEKYAELEKETAKLEAEIERLRAAKGQKLSKEADEHAAPPCDHQKRAGRHGQAEEKRPWSGGGSPDDRAWPRNGPERDDGFL